MKKSISSTTRSKRYLARKKFDRYFDRFLPEYAKYSLVDKLKIKKGGKFINEVYMKEYCANMPYWTMSS